MRPALLVIMVPLLLMASSVWCQQRYEIRDTATVPLRYYVGDPVLLRFRVAISPAAEDRVLRAPEELPSTPLIEVTQIVVTQVGDWEYDVSISFRSFLPGTSRLPQVDLGAVVLEDLHIDTRSILEDRKVNAPTPPRAPLVLPGTWRRISVVLLLLVLGPLLFLWLIRAARHTAARINKLRKRRLPINHLLRALKRLRRQDIANTVETEPGPAGQDIRVQWGRRFYIELTAAAREYLGRRLDLPVHTATTVELRRLLLQSGTPATPSAHLLSVFGRADRVKFGGVPLDTGEVAAVLDQVESVARQYEEVLGAQS